MSINNRSLFVRLNNYNYSKPYLEQVAHFLTTGKAPSSMNEGQSYRFRKRYGKDFELRGDIIVFKPLDLELVPDELELKEAKMRPLYDDMKVGCGMGIASFYAKVCQQYLGISRNEVAAFMKKQTPYQLTKGPVKPLNKPLVAEYPNHKWCADLVDLSLYKGHNGGKRYVLSVIDIFSRYVWAISIHNKEPKTLIDAFKKIHSITGVYPIILIYDNGTETMGEFIPWAEEENDIKIVRTATHTPTSNALVENFNRYLRKMIREGFVRTNSLKWAGQPLADYCFNRNHTKHGRMRFCPYQVWSATREPIAKPRRVLPQSITGTKAMTQNQIQNKATTHLHNAARRDLERYEDEKFEIGNKVRVKMTAISSKVRKEEKAGRGKNIVVKYTPKVYEVTAIRNPKPDTLQKPQYVTTYSGKPFWASELLLVDDEAQDVDINLRKLNKFEKVGNKNSDKELGAVPKAKKRAAVNKQSEERDDEEEEAEAEEPNARRLRSDDRIPNYWNLPNWKG